MKDIENIEDIRIFVDAFYAKVRRDDLLGPVFTKAIVVWQPHLDQMYAFWNAALFGGKGFNGNPYAKHANLPIGPNHFSRWLELFSITVRACFAGPVADDAINRAGIMAKMFLIRLSSSRDSPKRTIV